MAALHRLADKKVVVVVDSESQTASRFLLPVDNISSLKKEQRQLEEFEEGVIQSWLEDVRKRHPDLTTTDAHMLAEDLARFSFRLYSLHSMESVSLYFGDDEKINTLVEQSAKEGLEGVLPERSSELHEIRMYELPRFFRDAPLDRKRYIAKQLNPIFLLHMLQLDPSCARLVSRHIQGGTLFLDTNFIYRLLGFHGAELQHASQRLLELSRGLGYVPVISPRTVEEYRKSIEQFKRRVNGLPRISPEVAEAALFAALEEDTNTQYWRFVKNNNGNFSAENHYELYRQLEVFLDQHNIAIDDRGADFIRANDQLLAQEESLLRRMLPDWQPRHDGIVAHDAYHRLLILTLRKGQEAESPLDTPFWFLTCDTKLAVYDRRARARQKLKIPYCVLSSHWMQLLSPFCAAVDGFEVIQAETLDSPLFRLFPSPDPQMLQDIISRMAISEGVPSMAIAKMITNQAFVRAFSEEQDDAKREELIQGFYGQYIDEIEQTQKKTNEQLEQLQLMLSDKDRQIQAMLADNSRLSQDIDQLNTKQATLQGDAKQTEQQLAEARAANEAIERRMQDVSSELKHVGEQTKDAEDRHRIEVENLRRGAQQEQERNNQLLAKIENDQRQQQIQLARQRKITLIGLTWITCVVVLVAIKPWEWAWPLKWLTLTVLILALIITQYVAINIRSISRYKAVALITLDVIALAFVILLPLGVTLLDTSNSLLWIAAIVSACCAVIAVLPSSKLP